MTHHARPLLAALAVAAATAFTACATTPPPPATIADIAAHTQQLSTLDRLIKEAGLADTLRGPGPFTVFAPTDEAFKAVPAKTLQELASNKDLLQSVLSYHVLPNKLMAADVKVGSVKTVQGGTLAIANAGSAITVEDAVVQQADVPASNGVVHIVDRVLIPPKK